ncbi:hypothetical protein [Roseobacter sp. EG26]|uniref:hypothetical protein n=1 Tax=Roseobacter sp. EG26 TaxID=3412477 RepID=UPI003CE520AC
MSLRRFLNCDKRCLSVSFGHFFKGGVNIGTEFLELLPRQGFEIEFHRCCPQVFDLHKSQTATGRNSPTSQPTFVRKFPRVTQFPLCRRHRYLRGEQSTLTAKRLKQNGDVASELFWRRLRRDPRADTPRQFFLTRAQAKRLITFCRPDLALLVQGALYSGCRVSELARLRARDVGGHVFGIYVEPIKSHRRHYVVLPNEGMTFFLDQVETLDDEDLVFRMSSDGRDPAATCICSRKPCDGPDYPKALCFMACGTLVQVN